ncbi:MAG TPA: Crp/Fnr family transcriptional regulator [Gemmatimonadaceae bacterium]|nr:Crp/Fnr family transcriptional regulator [Gemmatimonadaceae bacterium]
MSSKPGRGPRTGGDGATAPPKPPQNEILSRLPPNELAMLLEHTSEISFTLREELFEEGDALERVYFPLNAMISLVNVLDDGTSIEVMTIGREGFIGFTLLNDVSTARYKGMCQIAGDCLTADANTFLAIIEKMPELRRRLRRYSQFANEVAAQSVACNSVHEVEQRLARWLLVTADAIDSKSFDITQEFLSQMLAVRRPGVTVAMGALGRRGLLDHRYGKVTLLDVEGLKKTSCECYRRITQKAAELLGD